MTVVTAGNIGQFTLRDIVVPMVGSTTDLPEGCIVRKYIEEELGSCVCVDLHRSVVEKDIRWPPDCCDSNPTDRAYQPNPDLILPETLIMARNDDNLNHTAHTGAAPHAQT